MTAGCRELVRAVDAYVDGELDASHVMVVEHHAVACAGCAARIEFQRATKRAIRAEAHAEPAPASLRARIARSAAALRAPAAAELTPEFARVATPVARPAASETLRAPSWRSALPWAAAAGVAIAVGGGVRSFGHGQRADGANVASLSASSARAQILEEFAFQHARPLPPEERDPSRITKVFSPIVGVPVRPVRLAEPPLGFSFAGARLNTLRDEPAATLFYEHGAGSRVTVFVFDPRRIVVRSECCLAPRTVAIGGEERTIFVGHAKGYSLAIAEHDGIGYALSADLPERELVALAANLSR
jgi:anti-sigma factor (TIGR02949 family)